MPTTIAVKNHSIIAGRKVIELEFDGHLLGTITGADGPGIRITTRHIDVNRVAIVPLRILPGGLVQFEIKFLNPHRS